MICDISPSGKIESDFITRLHVLGYRLPVIVIAAPQEIAHIARAMRAGIEDVILKPVSDFSLLEEALLRILFPHPPRAEEEAMFSYRYLKTREAGLVLDVEGVIRR